MPGLCAPLVAACAKWTKRAALHGIVAEGHGFPGNRGAGRDFQPATPGDLARRVLLRRRRFGPDGQGVGPLLAQIVLEFFVVGFGDRVPAGDEGIDGSPVSLQRDILRFCYGRKIKIDSVRVI